MIRLFIVILLTLSIPFSAFAQGMRPLNEVSIVALIITSGAETEVSESVTETLESLDAQTLTANAPNASEMRSILKRFAAAAIDTDVALIYYDGGVLKIGDREFVAPGGIELRRPSDLLTKAIPLSALARATALAINGGAVLVHSSGQNIDLINGVTLVENAPVARTGTSPILVASATAAQNLADGLGAMAEAEGDIELNMALADLASLEGVSISQMPAGKILLRQITVAEPLEIVDAPAPVAEVVEALTARVVENSGLALPQVVPVEDITEAPEDSYATTVAETVDALESAIGEPVATNEETSAVEEMAETAEEVAELAPALSIEVLRAMQGALSRSEKRELQQHLRALGYYRGLIDGIFGPQTARAISAYQESISAEVTGILTPAQLDALSQ